MKIWTLMENTTCREDFTAEHGLSLYLETGEHKILFDTGASGAFADNAQTLGIDLSAVTIAVISHGHYDHGGGLSRFLQENHSAPIYLRPEAFQSHFNKDGKDIGLTPLLSGCDRLVFTRHVHPLASGITLYSCQDRALSWSIDPAGLQMESDGQLLPEDFRHEQYLLVEEQGKRILISGCSHRGICNIVSWFRPDVLIGGFHFMNRDPEGPDRTLLEKAADHLLSCPTRYYTGHCTGEKPFAFLKERMGAQLQGIHTGSVLTL